MVGDNERHIFGQSEHASCKTTTYLYEKSMRFCIFMWFMFYRLLTIKPQQQRFFTINADSTKEYSSNMYKIEHESIIIIVFEVRSQNSYFNAKPYTWTCYFPIVSIFYFFILYSFMLVFGYTWPVFKSTSGRVLFQPNLWYRSHNILHMIFHKKYKNIYQTLTICWYSLQLFI